MHEIIRILFGLFFQWATVAQETAEPMSTVLYSPYDNQQSRSFTLLRVKQVVYNSFTISFRKRMDGLTDSSSPVVLPRKPTNRDNFTFLLLLLQRCIFNEIPSSDAILLSRAYSVVVNLWFRLALKSGTPARLSMLLTWSSWVLGPPGR
jgi:hypothetical protein